MDSLLANYASSDDEDQQPSAPPPRAAPAISVNSDSKASIPPKSTSERGRIFYSLPPPKSSLFNLLPPPKSKPIPNPNLRPELEHEKNLENSKPKSSSSSLFSSLPPPKSSSSSAASKKVVQFRPPAIVNPTGGAFNDSDEDSDEGEQDKRRKKPKESISTASATSFLSSIPAPRFSANLGSGSGRGSMLETDIPTSTLSIDGPIGSDSVANTDQSNDTNYRYSSLGLESENHAYFSGLGGESSGYHGSYGVGSTDAGGAGTAGCDSGVNYNEGPDKGIDYSYGNGGYDNNALYDNNWDNKAVLPEVSEVVESAFRVPGKRGRKDVPEQIVEVKQVDLMKNRPREDQVKSTGIAFGPSYQPVSTKGKPTKLHKRKHQISSLYFDMRQKEAELAERRSKGFLTKAQTQAKYGW